MKKFFLFAAAVVAAMTVNATVHNFAGITADQIVVDAQGSIGTYMMDEQEIPSVSYTSTVGTLMEVSISSMSNLKIQYKNGNETKDGHKDNILKFAEKYMQTDGKNVVLVLSGLRMDDEIQILVAAKGSTNAVFAATGADPDPENPASVAKDEYKVLKFFATGSEVSLKETAGGYRIKALAINEDVPSEEQGIEELIAAPKASKVVYNGQVVIVKAGRMYNLLGAEIAK